MQMRMIYTNKTVGRATILTSFTTAAAYAANTFSQVITEKKKKKFLKYSACVGWLLGCRLIEVPPSAVVFHPAGTYGMLQGLYTLPHFTNI